MEGGFFFFSLSLFSSGDFPTRPYKPGCRLFTRVVWALKFASDNVTAHLVNRELALKRKALPYLLVYTSI